MFVSKVSKPTIKTIVTVIGAAVSGAPAVFLQGLGSEKWFYPVGVVAGFFWSRFAASARAVKSGPSGGKKIAWYFSIIEVAAISISTLVLLLVAAFSGSRGISQPASRLMPLAETEMPCRLAWVFLGRFSPSKARYVVPPGFRYLDDQPRSPIPEPGDKVEITASRNLLISGFHSSDPSRKCDHMLDPPVGYRPETADKFQTGGVIRDRVVLLHQIALLPDGGADPVYVWGLVSPPR